MNEPQESTTPLETTGLGCPGGAGGDTEKEVYRLLKAGSPRLALATAQCVPFQPFFVNCVANFATVDQATIPDIGTDTPFQQDSIIEDVAYQVLNTSPPTATFDTLSDFFYNLQCGINAKINVSGRPGYPVAAKFTPLRNMCDVLARRAKNRRHPWIVFYDNDITMDFSATVSPLPFTLIVTVTFQCWAPMGQAFVGNAITNRQAVAELAAMGIDVGCYVNLKGRCG